MTTTDGRALLGKTAIVTGAGRGIGAGVALALAQAGADVVLAARSTDQLEKVAAQIESHGVRALPIRTDITRVEDVEAMVARAVEVLGHVDVLVNNSGVITSKELLDTTDAEWSAVIDTNLTGAFLATRAVGRHLVAQGSGKVVTIASNFAIRGHARHAAYCASKAGLVSFTRAMAMEWARHNIQVNALCPGYVETDLNTDVRADPEMTARILRAVPARRMAQVSELGPWVVMLASAASDFMTGESIVLDGGQSV